MPSNFYRYTEHDFKKIAARQIRPGDQISLSNMSGNGYGIVRVTDVTVVGDDVHVSWNVEPGMKINSFHVPEGGLLIDVDWTTEDPKITARHVLKAAHPTMILRDDNS